MAVLHPLVTPRGLVNIKEKKRVRQLWWGSLLQHCTCTAGSHSAPEGTRGRRRGGIVVEWKREIRKGRREGGRRRRERWVELRADGCLVYPAWLDIQVGKLPSESEMDFIF